MYDSQPEIYGLEQKDAKNLLRYTNDISFVINYVQEKFKYRFSEEKIKLPGGMTIGMEIESEGDTSVALLHSSEILDGWETKADKSLEDGVEVVSPVLRSEDNREKKKSMIYVQFYIKWKLCIWKMRVDIYILELII